MRFGKHVGIVLLSALLVFVSGCAKAHTEQRVFLSDYPTKVLDLNDLNSISAGSVKEEVFWFVGGAGGGYWDAKQDHLEPMDLYGKGVCNVPCDGDFVVTISSPTGSITRNNASIERYDEEIFPQGMVDGNCDPQLCVAYTVFSPVLPGDWKVQIQGGSLKKKFEFKVEVPKGPKVYWWREKHFLILTHFAKKEVVRIVVWRHDTATDMNQPLPVLGWKTFTTDENGQLRVRLSFSPWDYPVTVENERGEYFKPQNIQAYSP